VRHHWQARSQAKLPFHFGASLTAVILAKLEVRQHQNDQAAPFPTTTVRRRYFNEHLIERSLSTLADGTTLDTSSPEYERLCNYDAMTHMAASFRPEALFKREHIYFQIKPLKTFQDISK
jgi:hypothetical protein